LLNQRSCPEEGWDELTINLFFNYLASMDSNNGLNHIGIGEREGRIFSKIVKNRNFGLVHGIGRSGEVTELQPKAVGSSLLVQLAHSVLQNFLHSIGYSFIRDLIILPLATGMSLTLTMLTLKQFRPVRKFLIRMVNMLFSRE
jgi:O-phospho-L-seryl-tRNASec:L-selenocysteinyl-tRNA synthase